MKHTAKLMAALRMINQLNLPTASEQSGIYNNLERAGYYWNSETQIWENLKRSSTMFANDDGLPTGVIRLRVMAHPGDMDQLMEVIRESLDSYGVTIQEESNPYPNRRGPGLRIYITGVLPKAVKKSAAKTKRASKPAIPA